MNKKMYLVIKVDDYLSDVDIEPFELYDSREKAEKRIDDVITKRIKKYIEKDVRRATKDFEYGSECLKIYKHVFWKQKKPGYLLDYEVKKKKERFCWEREETVHTYIYFNHLKYGNGTILIEDNYAEIQSKRIASDVKYLNKLEWISEDVKNRKNSYEEYEDIKGEYLIKELEVNKKCEQ